MEEVFELYVPSLETPLTYPSAYSAVLLLSLYICELNDAPFMLVTFPGLSSRVLSKDTSSIIESLYDRNSIDELVRPTKLLPFKSTNPLG